MKRINTTSVSYDYIAKKYDKAYIIDKVIESQLVSDLITILHSKNAEKVLDLGVGTGRFLLPLNANKFTPFGADISMQMLHRAQEKGRNYNTVLTCCNATRLPFVKDSFDTVIVSHLFHLIDGWNQAIGEIRRTLTPSGSLMHHWSCPEATALREKFKAKWIQIFFDKDIDIRRPGVKSQAEFTETMLSSGARIEYSPEITGYREFTPRGALGIYENRLWSDTWTLPDEIFEQGIKELKDWANMNWENMDEMISWKVSYQWQIITWDK